MYIYFIDIYLVKNSSGVLLPGEIWDGMGRSRSFMSRSQKQNSHKGISCLLAVASFEYYFLATCDTTAENRSEWQLTVSINTRQANAPSNCDNCRRSRHFCSSLQPIITHRITTFWGIRSSKNCRFHIFSYIDKSARNLSLLLVVS